MTVVLVTVLAVTAACLPAPRLLPRGVPADAGRHGWPARRKRPPRPAPGAAAGHS